MGGHLGLAKVPDQWRSRLPCSKQEQKVLRENVMMRCKDWTRVFEAMAIMVAMMYFPMGVIIFKFLSNRCGDEFAMEDQFAIYSDSDSSDDSDIEAGDDKKVKK